MKIILKSKKAQQLVEFLLVAPFLIIFLGILTEYAYALNVNLTINQGLKDVTASIYSQIKPEMTSSEIDTIVKTKFTEYLENNNVPTKTENNIRVSFVNVNSTAVFMASYKYIPAFTLPNVYFKFIPDELNFFATSAVPSAFVSQNNYGSSIDSETLDKIWSSSSNFASLDSFNDSKNGIIKKDDKSFARSRIIFLVKNNSITKLTNPYSLVNWAGNLITNPSGNVYTYDEDNGNFYTCSSTACSNESQTLYNYLISNNYFNVFFIEDSASIPDDLTTLSSFWVLPANSSDLSEDTVNGILKQALAIETDNFSVGNYDNIAVSAYNMGVSLKNTYTMKAFGSMVIIYSVENIDKFLSGATPKSIDYSF